MSNVYHYNHQRKLTSWENMIYLVTNCDNVRVNWVNFVWWGGGGGAGAMNCKLLL